MLWSAIFAPGSIGECTAPQSSCPNGIAAQASPVQLRRLPAVKRRQRDLLRLVNAGGRGSYLGALIPGVPYLIAALATQNAAID